MENTFNLYKKSTFIVNKESVNLVIREGLVYDLLASIF